MNCQCTSPFHRMNLCPEMPIKQDRKAGDWVTLEQANREERKASRDVLIAETDRLLAQADWVPKDKLQEMQERRQLFHQRRQHIRQ